MQEASKLMSSGHPEDASAKIIAFFRAQLPEDHPSKEPQTTGIIEGDRVSAFNSFESSKTQIEEASRFGSVLTRMLEHARFNNYWHILGSCLITYFRDERPDLLRHFTNHMLKDVEKIDGFLAKQQNDLPPIT